MKAHIRMYGRFVSGVGAAGLYWGVEAIREREQHQGSGQEFQACIVAC